jgi:hypothetical protein
MKPGETGMTIKAEGKKVQVKKLEVTLDTKEVVLQFGTSPELGVLGVRVDQPEAKIYIGTTELGKGEVRRTAKPGTYVVRVVLEGFQEWTQTVDIEAGRTVESSVMLRPLDFDKPGSQKKSAAWKWAILGSAVALAAAGGGTYAVASKNLDTERTSYNKWLVDTYHLDGKVPDTKAAQDEATKEWDDRVASGVTPMQVASYALWGVAGAAAVTGAILLVTHDSGGADAKSSLYVPTVSPVMLPGNGAGAMLNITF